jgi:alpha-beta hydrolase superfamily lysophospholipase
VELPDPEWRLFRPEVGGGTGVLLLAGSSGRVDAQRAAVLARQGATVLAIRWFGGPCQQPGPYDVPLELFTDALDLLAPECDRFAVMGTSFGAEACLIVASLDDRVAATVAFAPSAHVWSGYGDDRWTSHWTWRGEPLPAVPFLPEWEPDSDPPAYRGLYAASLAAADPATVAAATIPVERIAGSLVLVAGGDDQVWPAADFAASITARRDLHGLATVVVTHPDAGHLTLLPGEPVVEAGQQMQRGGTVEADRLLGELAWPAIVDYVVQAR